MFANSCRFLHLTARASTVLAGLMMASCVPQLSSPEQVQANNPNVTYKYKSDQELVQANQNAATFCDRYQSVPRTANITNDPDGSRIVVFECVQTSAAVSAPHHNPNLAYSYRTDQELLDSSRNAQKYCMNNGAQYVVSNIATNVNGTKTVTYQCSPR